MAASLTIPKALLRPILLQLTRAGLIVETVVTLGWDIVFQPALPLEQLTIQCFMETYDKDDTALQATLGAGSRSRTTTQGILRSGAPGHQVI